MDKMIAVSFGGGLNSTALLILLRDNGVIPDYITFADTGGERPSTYSHVFEMGFWCSKNNFPDITVVRKGGKIYKGETLEQNCLRKKMLPSLAYGFKGCSHKYKIQPQDMFFNNLPEAKEIWSMGEKITKYIGYDADEERRAKINDDEKYEYKYPLIEAGIGRSECKELILNEGLRLPGKSSCFFCPATSINEIKWMNEKSPDLINRAIAMESNADLTTVKGLGRSFRWADVIATDDMFSENYIEIDCGCYDG